MTSNLKKMWTNRLRHTDMWMVTTEDDSLSSYPNRSAS